MLKRLKQNLSDYTPQHLLPVSKQAGVLVALTDEVYPQVVLTKRASQLNTHSGEVALPGGKKDDTDPDLLFTALREAQEEVGLNPESVEIIGSLGHVMSLHGLRVSPWVGVIPADTELIANPDELDLVFKVPLQFFLDDQRYRTDSIKFRNRMHYVPAWEYQGQIIWGLTAYILVELLNVGLQAGIPMKQRPEHIAKGDC